VKFHSKNNFALGAIMGFTLFRVEQISSTKSFLPKERGEYEISIIDSKFGIAG
jgi:hypothetical protein